jgi:hypothetical protein
MTAKAADVRTARGGRPRLSPEGRGASLTISINPNTRVALEEASTKLGRSLSQTAEFAIERGRFLGDLGAAAPSVAVAINLMLRFAAEVQRDEGDPSSSDSARAELREGWKLIAEHALPFGSDPARHALAETQREALLVLSHLESLDRLGSLAQVAAKLQSIADGTIARESPEWLAVRKELRAASDTEEDEFVALLLAGVHLRMLATSVDAQKKPAEWAARGAERALARLRGMGVIGPRDGPGGDQ